MKMSLASWSLVLFIVSLVMLVLLTLFESSFTGMPTAVERTASSLLLVLPASLGAVVGGMSLYRRERRAWIAIAGILLNAFFAIFNLLVLSFAG